MDEDKTEFANQVSETGSESTQDFPRLGKYQVKRILGEGAMGVVYEAFDPHIERTVAIKTVRKNLLDNQTKEEVLARFKREAQSAGQLSHPGIVSVYEYDETSDTGFISMEYVEGEELSAIFSRGEKPRNEHVVDLVIQLLEALSFAHAKGIVHRDIKPSNIIITPQGKIKLTDFGIARVDSSSLTQAGSVLGTPAFMSPEQCIGGDVDARSDLFSVGAVMYYMLTGEKPFPGESAFTVIQRVISNDPEPASRINPMLSESVDKILLRALEKKPQNRYQSAEAFIADLKNLSFSEVEQTVTDPTLPQVEKAPQANNNSDMKAGSSAGLSNGLIVGLLAAIAVAGGGAYWFLNESNPIEPVSTDPVSAAPLTATVPVETNSTVELDQVLSQLPNQSSSQSPSQSPNLLSATNNTAPRLKLFSDRGGQPVYQVGEIMQLSVSIDRSAHLYCFYQDATGNVMRILPNDNTPNNFIQAGRVLTLPSASDIYTIVFQDPGTTETVFCLSSSSEVSPLMQSVSLPALAPLPMSLESIKQEFENNNSVSELAISRLTVNVSR